MKKRLIITFLFCALTLSGCTQSGTSGTAVKSTELDVIVEDTESVQLAQDYAFYTESVDKLKSDMRSIPLRQTQSSNCLSMLVLMRK